jgi:general secretion pathway protein I
MKTRRPPLDRRPSKEAPRNLRAGLSLLEVIIALAIFLFSFTAIAQLLSFSSERVIEGHLRSQANLRCQSKLAEVLAGAEPLTGSGWSSFSDSRDWEWQVTSNEADIANLSNVQVSVRKKKADKSYLEVSVSQMVFAPAQRGSTLVYLANITDGPSPSTQKASSSGSMAGGGTSGNSAKGAATAKTATPTKTGGATKGGGGYGGGTGRGGGATRGGGAGGGTGRGGATGGGRGGAGGGAGGGMGAGAGGKGG